MKSRLYFASILALVAILVMVVPVSAGKVKTFNVVFPADPITGVNWTPSITINWEGYRAYYVAYFIYWRDSAGVTHNNGTYWQFTAVNPGTKGPRTQTLNLPFTFARLADNANCWVKLGGGIFNARKTVTLNYDEKYYAGVCVQQVTP